MNPVEYLRAIRRRWVDVALAVVVAVTAGFFISSVAPPGPVLKSYEATSVLLASGNFFAPGAPSLAALSELTTVGEVPERAKFLTGFKGQPSDLARLVETSRNEDAGILRIKVTTTDPETAKRYADAFAKGLVGYLHDLQATSVSAEAASVQAGLEALEAEIADLEDRIAEAGPRDSELLVAQRDALINQYRLQYEAYRQLASTSSNPVNLDVIQAATPREITSGGIQPPRSRVARLILAGLLGLISGVILVLILDRFDTRIRSRQMAEKHFGLPVLAEIPFVARLRRRPDRIESAVEPRSSTADAYRIVAAILSMPSPGALAQADDDGNGNGSGNGIGIGNGAKKDGGARKPPRRILVTSPGPSDGKTTVAANLAAVFGARGNSTIVFSCDLRRPRIHRMFGVANSPGLSEVLAIAGSGVPAVPLLDSPVAPHVRVVPSGAPPEEPGEILGSDLMRMTLQAAQERSEVIVIDTAPVLVTSDAAPLLHQVDAVIVVARAGRTTAEVAERTSEMLRRLNAPVVGVILNAANQMSVPRRYYSYRYYRRPSGRRGFPRLARHRVKEYRG